MNKPKQRVAIVHDLLFPFGGAETVLYALLDIFPEADLHTLAAFPQSQYILQTKYPNVRLHTSPFQRVPLLFSLGKYVSIIKIFSWVYWELLHLGAYDLIISSSHSFGSKAVKGRPNALHISYIHTSPKYLYNEFSEWLNLDRFPLSLVTLPLTVLLRFIDKRGASRPDILVANSKEVQQRIQRYYHRPSIIVYPPANTTHRILRGKKAYYLCLSRLSKQKGVRLAVQTCSQYQLPLLVVGEGSELPSLQKIAGPTVVFYGSCREDEKLGIYSQARALIYPAIDEDFGITPIEAMSYEVPVIAYNSGGVKETVINNKTGVLFNEYTEGGLKNAIDALHDFVIDPQVFRRWVGNFSKNKFRQRFIQIIQRS